MLRLSKVSTFSSSFLSFPLHFLGKSGITRQIIMLNRQFIYVICRLGGRYSEELWPRAYFFSCSKLVLHFTNGFVYATCHCCNEQVTQILDKGRCIKEHIYIFRSTLCKLHLFHQFSKIVFPAWNFVRNLEYYYKNNFVSRCYQNHLKLGRSTMNRITESKEIR